MELRRSTSVKEGLAAYLLLLPSLVGFFIVIVMPVVSSLLLSFTKWNFLTGLGGIRFDGIANFQYLFSGKDQWFSKSMINTVIFTLVTVPAGLVIGMLVAVLIQRYVYAPNFFKVVVFIPYISSIVASAVVWMVVFQPSYGPINNFLKAIGVVDPPKWFTDVRWAFPTLLAFHVWQTLGYNVIVYLAGLSGISRHLYEAATIDGARETQKFRYITVPLVSPTTFFLTIMGIIGSFKVFDSIKILTSGGPGNQTTNISYYIYREAFNFYRMGTANAAAWIMFVVIFIVTMIQLRQQNKWVIYE